MKNGYNVRKNMDKMIIFMCDRFYKLHFFYIFSVFLYWLCGYLLHFFNYFFLVHIFKY